MTRDWSGQSLSRHDRVRNAHCGSLCSRRIVGAAAGCAGAAGLLWDLESDPVLRGEILEQRKERSTQAARAMTLAECASFVRTPMGEGFSGGLLELAALGKLTEQDVYLWGSPTRS